MKKIFIISLMLISFNVYGQMSVANIEAPVYSKAIINVINKKKGQFKDIEVIIGNEATFEEIVIKVSACNLKQSEFANDFWAYVNFKNQNYLFENEEGKEIKEINLWLSSLSPSLSSVDDETYDIKLIRCEK